MYANDSMNPYASFGLAAEAGVDERAAFITKTYLHLAGAVGCFALLTAALLQLPGIERFAGTMVSGYNWLIVMAAYMGVSYLAQKWAMSATSMGTQYLGLGLYVVAEAVIFVPILLMASMFYENAIATAAIITGVTFAGLTGIVFVTRKDFSFLGPILGVFGMAMMGVVICSVLFGFSLGIVFTGVMVAMMCGYIVYDTSNVLHHYHIGQHVAASLALFASVVTLFWYILRLVMILNDER